MPTQTRLDLILLAAVVGFLGGLLGALVAALFFLPTFDQSRPEAIMGRSGGGVRVQEVYAQVARAMVRWYGDKRLAHPEGLGDAPALGLVVSSDGWIVGPQSVVKNNLSPVNDRAPLTTEKITTDPWTGFVLVKTTSRDLVVVSFRDTLPVLGERVFIPGGDGSFVPSSVVAVRAPSPGGKFATVFTIQSMGVSGAPVFDVSGKVIGLSLGDSHVMPIGHLMPALQSVFKKDLVVRPDLGLDVQDLGSARVVSGGERGAKVIAVRAGSPGARAGVVVGDVIIRINNESIDAHADLYERLQYYAPGETVRLEIMRDGKTSVVTATLGSKT